MVKFCGENNNQLCSDIDCCLINCNKDNFDFQPQCNTTDFIYITDKTQFCQ